MAATVTRNNVQNAINPAPSAAAHMPKDGLPMMHQGRLPPILPWPDIGRIAKWSVSSYKFGFGAECLRDGDPDTFWHWLQDDSYTPSNLAIRAGTGPSDLQDVRVAALEKPDGWITFDVSSEPDEDGTTQ
ncbi:hypothetical protein PAXINDRAFT_157105 [Paxillus involutus ATCC 200175]|uniref:DOC domain-containing protein n=1 Tax=Paxillus involutus ATCC 200175 TaxID=664439 RepID=A0A0C9T8M1_PAXIN|nr:hypothetical protein PAXINDRAFT_157105 [Paxillus involutus ATCC 200175]